MCDSPIQVEVTQNVEQETRALVARQLQEFSAPYLGNHPFGNLDVYVRNGDGDVIGGLVGEFAFGWLVIRVLWLAESFSPPRHWYPDTGSAENAAIEKGCHGAILDTMSFQAPGYYQKHGYVRVGGVDGYPGGAQQIFMRKDLGRNPT